MSSNRFLNADGVYSTRHYKGKKLGDLEELKVNINKNKENIQTNTNDITTIQNQIQELINDDILIKNSVTNINTKVTEHTSTLTTLRNDVDSIENDVSDNTENINGLASSVQLNINKIADHENRITELESGDTDAGACLEQNLTLQPFQKVSDEAMKDLHSNLGVSKNHTVTKTVNDWIDLTTRMTYRAYYEVDVINDKIANLGSSGDSRIDAILPSECTCTNFWTTTENVLGQIQGLCQLMFDRFYNMCYNCLYPHDNTTEEQKTFFESLYLLIITIRDECPSYTSITGTCNEIFSNIHTHINNGYTSYLTEKFNMVYSIMDNAPNSIRGMGSYEEKVNNFYNYINNNLTNVGISYTTNHLEQLPYVYDGVYTALETYSNAFSYLWNCFNEIDPYYESICYSDLLEIQNLGMQLNNLKQNLIKHDGVCPGCNSPALCSIYSLIARIIALEKHHA